LTYKLLKHTMQLYRENQIGKQEMAIAIHSWQRAQGYQVAELPKRYLELSKYKEKVTNGI
jgi:hypothetical protein